MVQSLAQLFVHLVFSTRQRERWIRGDDRERVQAYLGGVLRDLKCPSLAVGVVSDHAHVLFLLARDRALSDVVREVKASSSKWIKTLDAHYGGFAWQAGYGAFSVSASDVEAVRSYVQGQEEHHRTRTFQEEFRELLEKHGVEYDERYVWD